MTPPADQFCFGSSDLATLNVDQLDGPGSLANSRAMDRLLVRHLFSC
jgi:hypothetical protein